MKRLVAIVGPTGIGKSRLAISLAARYGGEIIGADSRQVYRRLDIGTAKPSPEELDSVPHHLIDIINPDEPFSLAQYLELARAAIADIFKRQKLPFLVGGTGLYVRAVLEGWRPPPVSPDAEFRYNEERRAGEAGADALYQELARLDPAAAQRIDPRNLRRVIRALEVRAGTPWPSPESERKEPPDFAPLVIGLTADRSELYARVDRRVDEMLARGLVNEVENLLRMGYDLDLPALSGIGYRQVGQYLRGELTRAEAVRRIKTATHRFIRHQYAWFRPADARIHWFDIGDDEAIINKSLEGFLASEED